MSQLICWHIAGAMARAFASERSRMHLRTPRPIRYAHANAHVARRAAHRGTALAVALACTLVGAGAPWAALRARGVVDQLTLSPFGQAASVVPFSDAAPTSVPAPASWPIFAGSVALAITVHLSRGRQAASPDNRKDS